MGLQLNIPLTIEGLLQGKAEFSGHSGQSIGREKMRIGELRRKPGNVPAGEGQGIILSYQAGIPEYPPAGTLIRRISYL